MSDEWKDGDRARVKPEAADGFTEPYKRLIKQGRYGTLHVYVRHGMRGPETNYDLVFDVLRKDVKPQKLGVDPRYLERP